MKVKARARARRNNLHKGPDEGFGVRFRAPGPGGRARWPVIARWHLARGQEDPDEV